MLQGTTYWTDLFVRHFLFQNESTMDCDDLLFFVRKKHVKGSSRYLPKFEVKYRDNHFTLYKQVPEKIHLSSHLQYARKNENSL